MLCWIGWVASMLASGIPASSADQPAKEAAVQAMAKANNAFAVDLYQSVAGAEGNLFLSPYSVSAALAMVYAGARGETAQQMADVLHFELPQDELHPALASLSQRIEAGEGNGCTLAIANALWTQSGLGLLDSFVTRIRSSYGAEPREVDFRAEPQEAVQAINAWVKRETQERIEDLFRQSDINRDTALVLANAIYFKGTWAQKFDAEATREAAFQVSPGRQVQVPMMRQTGDFAIGGGEGVLLLEIPYAGGETSMVIVLPAEADGLAAVEQALDAGAIEQWLGRLRKREVQVLLPRFEMTSRFDLTGILPAMGMTAAFSRGADFSGINGQHDLQISKVVHKAFVTVDEEGTEAAAATGVGMKRTAMPPTFKADHPFVFLIRHLGSGTILFIGRVADPTM